MNTLHYYYTSPRYTSLRFASRFTKLHHASFALRTLESTLTNSTNWCLCSKVQNRGRELHHLVLDGRVVFVPCDSTTVGLFDPRTSATRKPAYTLSQPLPPSWNVALLPYYNKY